MNIARRDEIEPLPDGFAGFWIAAPADIITLIRTPERTSDGQDDAAWS